MENVILSLRPSGEWALSESICNAVITLEFLTSNPSQYAVLCPWSFVQIGRMHHVTAKSFFISEQRLSSPVRLASTVTFICDRRSGHEHVRTCCKVRVMHASGISGQAHNLDNEVFSWGIHFGLVRVACGKCDRQCYFVHAAITCQRSGRGWGRHPSGV